MHSNTECKAWKQRPRLSACVIQFPPRGPFAVRVIRDGVVWLVISRSHAWAFGDRQQAMAEAIEIARGFGVAVKA